MTKRTLILALAVAACTSPLRAQTPAATPEESFRLGYKDYKAGRYEEGLARFEAARDGLKEPAPFDPALVQYNLGIGYYRTSRPDEAASAFQSALRTPNLDLQGKAYFNLGNSLYQIARRTLDEGDVAGAFRSYLAAQTNYVQAMRIAPDDRDAKINYELTVLEQQRILQLVAMVIGQLRQGDQMVNEYRFLEAAQWFQQNLPVAEKALALEPEMKKLFEQMAERSGQVADIIAPPEPQALPGGTP